MQNIAVIYSIKQKHCLNIINRVKIWEVRKTLPKLQVPFICYIYETKESNLKNADWYKETFIEYGVGINGDQYAVSDNWNIRNGHIIGSFICDKIVSFDYCDLNSNNQMIQEFLTQSCLSIDEIKNYAAGKTIHGLHISNLTIYSTPKNIDEFESPHVFYRNCKKDCPVEEYARCPHKDSTQVNHLADWCVKVKKITRAPQSYCYTRVH